MRLPKTKIHSKNIVKVALLSIFGIGVAVLTNGKYIADYVAQKSNLETLKPTEMTGNVVKTLERFSFKSQDGIEYHIYDPNEALDKLAKSQDKYPSNGFYELDNLRLKGIISKVGNYGHMGRYERQITVIDVTSL